MKKNLILLIKKVQINNTIYEIDSDNNYINNNNNYN